MLPSPRYGNRASFSRRHSDLVQGRSCTPISGGHHSGRVNGSPLIMRTASWGRGGTSVGGDSLTRFFGIRSDYSGFAESRTRVSRSAAEVGRLVCRRKPTETPGRVLSLRNNRSRTIDRSGTRNGTSPVPTPYREMQSPCRVLGRPHFLLAQ